MNEGSLPEEVAGAEKVIADALGTPDGSNQQPTEIAGGGLEQNDQERVAALVDQIILQYKQALRENRQRQAQEILEAARRRPEIAELLAPKLHQVEQAQKEMDKLKMDTAATFRIIGNMLSAFSQDRRGMHPLNNRQATELLDEFRRFDKQLVTSEDINSITNTLIQLGDWAEHSVLPALNRTAQKVGEYFRGRIPSEINDEGVRLQRLARTFMATRTDAATIRRNFDAI